MFPNLQGHHPNQKPTWQAWLEHVLSGRKLEQISFKAHREKKSELLNSYENDYSYSKIARSLGRAELIMGDYHFYNRKTEILKQLTNEDIKEVAKKYFNKNNMQIVTIIINEKNWFTPFISFIANHIVLRFWDPEN